MSITMSLTISFSLGFEFLKVILRRRFLIFIWLFINLSQRFQSPLFLNQESRLFFQYFIHLMGFRLRSETVSHTSSIIMRLVIVTLRHHSIPSTGTLLDYSSPWLIQMLISSSMSVYRPSLFHKVLLVFS